GPFPALERNEHSTTALQMRLPVRPRLIHGAAGPSVCPGGPINGRQLPPRSEFPKRSLRACDAFGEPSCCGRRCKSLSTRLPPPSKPEEEQFLQRVERPAMERALLDCLSSVERR